MTLARILGQLGKIGSNINQIAAAANSGDLPAESSLRHALDDVAAMRLIVMEAMGRQP